MSDPLKIRQHSDAYTTIASRLLFPLHEKLKKHVTVNALKKLESSQWQTPEQIKQLQLQRLRELLNHVYINVPFFKDLFTQLSFDPEKVNSLDALTKLPFLTKAIIRENSERLKSNIPDNLAKFNTGGSSGQPLVFYIGNERVSHDVAAKWRATRWWGVDIGDPELVVWGSPIELGAQDKVRLIRDKLLRTKLLPAFDMSDEKLQGFIKEIIDYKPKMLFGYPSALGRIAKYAHEHSIDMTRIGIKVVFVTSEYLYPEQRHLIEKCFGCKVANGYGGRDAGFIAHECPSGNMHITAEDIIVEIIDPQGQPVEIGKSGEIVVTHLATKGYPFIRYRTGDIGVLDDMQCACGRGLPILKEIQGRTTDFVVSQNGSVMHGLALIYVLREITSINEFKIVQETKDATRIYLIVNSDFTEIDRSEIIKGFKARLGEGVEINIECVDKIPVEKSGKFRYVISHAI
ncbi:MAG: AMP-binding protein [Gammaproteobacteria bacterium]|nr:AMP-binding protein [Gammaproteobacteria bacterium]